jgi:hypothetical protein
MSTLSGMKVNVPLAGSKPANPATAASHVENGT